MGKISQNCDLVEFVYLAEDMGSGPSIHVVAHNHL